jgi:hypothetical protein
MSRSFDDLINSIDPLSRQFSIPTYDLDTDSPAAFKEDESQAGKPGGEKGRRTLIVTGRPHTVTNPEIIAYVWVFSMDGKDTLGPFNLAPETNMRINIDEHSWGAVIDPLENITVSVWIE